jgi:hypothetical protein
MTDDNEITEWLSRNGRKTLTVEAARQLALESPDHWYIASGGGKGFVVGKMTPQKFSQRHIVVDEAGQAMLFSTVESATAFLRVDLKVPRPHVFNF